MAEAAHQFGNITLAGRGGVTSGLLKISNGGFSWRRHGSDKPVVVKKEEISGLVWTLVGKRGGQLGVRRVNGPTVNFMGFKPADKEALANFCQGSLEQELIAQELAVSGRNWGAVGLNGSSLMYKVDEKVMFEVPLPDVSQAQQTKDEVLLEFHVDDTVDDREDTLIEMAFHVPGGNPDWAPDGEVEGEEGAARVSAAKALVDALLQHTDAGASTSDDAVITFHNVASLAPRGRFQVEMHLSYLQLVGQTQDFKIRYTSIGRLFILPKSSTPHTLVVVGLDPPIRKGQTYYSYLLCQFENGDDVTEKLDISDEDLDKKNKECGGKLHRQLTGPEYQVFAHALRGLSSAKITRARTDVYQNHAGDGCAVRCSYKADDGFLYPLEKAFFYVHKPPMCINHNDIEYVEFQRQGSGAAASSVRTFDLLIRQRSVNADFLFRNIQRSEWEPLFTFINQRKIRIENLAEARQGPRTAAPAIDFGLGEDLDAGLRAARAEADDEEEEDEDFSAGGEDMSDSSDGSLDEEAGDGSDDDAEMVDEEGIDVTAVMGKKGKKRKADGEPGEDGEAAGTPAPPKPKKEPTLKKPRAPKAAKPADGGAEDEEVTEAAADGKKQRKPRKKKDPNAPKKALSAFMFFSNANRERVKTTNPGVAFGQVGKLLGEEWKALSAEDKAPYEAQAAKDKERYAAAMAEYKASGGGQEASGAADEGEAAEGEAGEDAQ